MKKNILSEVNRVLEIMSLPTLYEQDIYMGKENKETIKIGEKIDLGTVKYAEAGMYTVGDDDPKNFINKFIDGIVEKVQNDERLLKALNEGTLQLAKANIRTGASNHFNVPLWPEVTNDYGSNLGGALNYYSEYGWDGSEYPEVPELTELRRSKDKDWIANKDLAERRATKFLAALKEGLIARDIKIFPAIEETVTSMIVDTGGMIDEVCRDYEICIQKHPNPGQFVDADLAFSFEVITPVFEDLLTCLGNMEIVVAYIIPYNKYEKRLNRGGEKGWLSKSEKWKRQMKKTMDKSVATQQRLGLPQSSKIHCCDSAVFQLWLNKTPIGRVNLNNNSEGGRLCGARAKKVVVSMEKAEKIAANNKDGKVTLWMKGVGSGTHGEVPLVKVVNGEGTVLFQGEPKKGAGGEYSWDKKEALFDPFSPCKKIE